MKICYSDFRSRICDYLVWMVGSRVTEQFDSGKEQYVSQVRAQLIGENYTSIALNQKTSRVVSSSVLLIRIIVVVLCGLMIIGGFL